MDLRSIAVNQNAFQEERTCEKGGYNKIKGMKKKHKIEDIDRVSGSLLDTMDKFGSMGC